jgi:hypothetical protein
MLTDADLAAMREAQDLALPDTCTRTRTALTQTAGGGYTETAASTLTPPCRTSSRGVPQEYLRQAVESGRAAMMVTVPQGSDVLATDKLTIGGVVYQVIGFASAGGWETALRCVCEVLS